MRYVVIGVNNDGGHDAVIVDSIEQARTHIRSLCEDCDPPLNEREKLSIESGLMRLDGSYVQVVQGSEAWKEWFYVAPLDEQVGMTNINHHLFHQLAPDGQLYRESETAQRNIDAREAIDAARKQQD